MPSSSESPFSPNRPSDMIEPRNFDTPVRTKPVQQIIGMAEDREYSQEDDHSNTVDSGYNQYYNAPGASESMSYKKSKKKKLKSSSTSTSSTVSKSESQKKSQTSKSQTSNFKSESEYQLQQQTEAPSTSMGSQIMNSITGMFTTQSQSSSKTQSAAADFKDTDKIHQIDSEDEFLDNSNTIEISNSQKESEIIQKNDNHNLLEGSHYKDDDHSSSRNSSKKSQSQSTSSKNSKNSISSKKSKLNSKKSSQSNVKTYESTLTYGAGGSESPAEASYEAYNYNRASEAMQTNIGQSTEFGSTLTKAGLEDVEKQVNNTIAGNNYQATASQQVQDLDQYPEDVGAIALNGQNGDGTGQVQQQDEAQGQGQNLEDERTPSQLLEEERLRQQEAEYQLMVQDDETQRLANEAFFLEKLKEQEEYENEFQYNLILTVVTAIIIVIGILGYRYKTREDNWKLVKSFGFNHCLPVYKACGHTLDDECFTQKCEQEIDNYVEMYKFLGILNSPFEGKGDVRAIPMRFSHSKNDWVADTEAKPESSDDIILDDCEQKIFKVVKGKGSSGSSSGESGGGGPVTIPGPNGPITLPHPPTQHNPPKEIQPDGGYKGLNEERKLAKDNRASGDESESDSGRAQTVCVEYPGGPIMKKTEGYGDVNARDEYRKKDPKKSNQVRGGSSSKHGIKSSRAWRKKNNNGGEENKEGGSSAKADAKEGPGGAGGKTDGAEGEEEKSNRNTSSVRANPARRGKKESTSSEFSESVASGSSESESSSESVAYTSGSSESSDSESGSL